MYFLCIDLYIINLYNIDRKKKKYQIINASANEGKETTVTSKNSETKQGDVKRKIVKFT